MPAYFAASGVRLANPDGTHPGCIHEQDPASSTPEPRCHIARASTTVGFALTNVTVDCWHCARAAGAA